MPEVNLGKVVGPKGSDGAQGPAGADGLSAYEQAQAGGYSGSELEFNQQLAGLSDGPFVPESDKGVASGVATLDSTGKVPSGQLPSMDYIPTSQKGAASGVASLDATGKLEETQKPDYTASEVGAVPTTRTVNGKSLSADVVLTGDDIKTSASDNTPIGDVVSVLGGATTPQAALANLGAGVRPNLLINPFFEVNQRGQTSYSGTSYAVYTVDGWLLNNAETATVNVLSNGVQIVAGTVTAQFRQYLESLSDGVYTLSFLFTDGSLGYAVYEKSGTAYTRKDYAGSDVWGLGMQDTGGKPTAFAFVRAGMSAAPVASKLESGEGQTLAYQDDTGAWQLLPQPESDYATQLALCQRYQLRLPYGPSQNYAPIGFGWAQTASSIRILIPTPVTMRANPVISYLSGDISGISLICNGKAVVPTAISQIAVQNYGVAIEFAASDATANMPCVMRMTNAYMMLDANL